MADTKALFTQRFDAARAALAKGDQPAAAESLHWAIVMARSDPALRRELASALFNLGSLSRKLGRAGEAEAGPLLTEALKISEEIFGREHPALAPVLNELSRLYLQQSQHARAAEVLERLVVIARAKGDDHPDVAAALSGLALVKRKLGDDAAAEALYRDALRIREKALEPNDMVTLGTMEKLSETCAARGNLVEALALLQRALPTREAVLGANHERVHATRSRIAELELQIAIAADTAAAAAAKARKDATPTPVWLKRVPDSPVDTPANAAPSSSRNSKEMELLGEPEPQPRPQPFRPAPRPRERSKTPAVAAAVAAASLMASSIKTPAVSQIAISPTENAHSSGATAGRESGSALGDVAFADIIFADVAHADAAATTPTTDAAVDEPRLTVAPAPWDESRPARGSRTTLYASVGMAAVILAIAGFLMLRPSTHSGTPPIASESDVAPRTVAAGNASVVTLPASQTVTSAPVPAAAAAAVVGMSHADSARGASRTSATSATSTDRAEQRAESAATQIRLPIVDVHVGAIDLPKPAAALSVDSILQSAMARRHAADSDGARLAKTELAPAAPAPAADERRTAPKLIGRVPDPGFPESLLRSGPREGEVVVRFMVNEAGTVDVATMVVERSDNEAFTDAVREVLPRFRFEPAHTIGPNSRPVAAWVSVPFRFTTKKK